MCLWRWVEILEARLQNFLKNSTSKRMALTPKQKKHNHIFTFWAPTCVSDVMKDVRRSSSYTVCRVVHRVCNALLTLKDETRDVESESINLDTLESESIIF